MSYQISLLEPARDFHSDSPWTEDSSDAAGLKNSLIIHIATLTSYRDNVQTKLIHETDLLIQRITNLISIDEGYRSRDTNASIRRLSWITVS